MSHSRRLHSAKSRCAGLRGLTILALVTATGLAAAQETTRVSVDSSAGQADAESLNNATSGDGRFVIFSSEATNLVPGDTNGKRDVFVRDRRSGTTWRVSVDSSGGQGDESSGEPAISADGRVAAFQSYASNLVPNDINQKGDIFVHDLRTGTTERVSLLSSGGEANGHSGHPSLSADGQFVAFHSDATNLFSGDSNGFRDVFAHDRVTGQTTLISLNSSGKPGNKLSSGPSISATGRYVAFSSSSTNLGGRDTNDRWDTFYRDRLLGTTQRVSRSSSGSQGNGDSFARHISADGRFVLFRSRADNLVPNDTNDRNDLFTRDVPQKTTERVSVDSNEMEANGDSNVGVISADGRFVAFLSQANNLVSGDTNGAWDIFVRDRVWTTTTRWSVPTSGVEANDTSSDPDISADGRFVTFWSSATNLVPGDTNGIRDVFVRGPALILEAEPESVASGDTLTLSTWTGGAGANALLAVIEVNGAPSFLIAGQGVFDSTGLWQLSHTVPVGLGGMELSLMAIGITATGAVESSNVEPLSFE